MKTILLIKSSIRKNRSSSFTLCLLMLLATILLYNSLLVLLNLDSVIDDINEKNNGADFVALTRTEDTDTVEGIISSLDYFDYLESEASICGYGSIQNKKVENDAQNIGLIFLKENVQRSMSVIPLIDEGKVKSENYVIVPYSLKSIYGYQTGDQIEIELGGVKRTFTIYGFLQNVIFSTPTNVDQYLIYVSDDEFEYLSESVPEEFMHDYINVRLTEKGKDGDFEDEFIRRISAQEGINDSSTIGLSYELMKIGATATISIIVVIVVIFALLLLAISLIVIRFTIITHIEEDAKNIGAMEAAGFTSGMIRRALILQFIMLTVMGFILGILCSVVLSKSVTSIVTSSTGLYWVENFSLMSALVALIVIVLFVTLISTKVSGRIKKITPIIALRNGLSNHNFKRNYLPFASTKGNLHILIGLKQMLQSGKQNIAIGIVGFILSFAFIMAFTMQENFASADSPVANLVGLEQADIFISYASIEQEERILEKLKKYDELDFCMKNGFTNIVLTANGVEQSTTCNVGDDFEKLRIKTVFDGRYPIHDNEIVLSNFNATKLKVKVGDVVTIKGKDGNFEYVVVGINQHINHLGISATMTYDGMLRNTSSYYNASLDLYIKDGVNIDNFIQKLENDLGEDSNSILNKKIAYDNIFKSIADICTLICYILSSVIVIVITIILFYMVKVKIIRDKTLLGINKAIGFTTKQLMLQNVISFCTVMFISFFIGALIFVFTASPICTLMFSIANFKKFPLVLSGSTIIICIVALMLLSILLTTLISLRIKKVNPVEFFMEA